jgi:hypothetical protein
MSNEKLERIETGRKLDQTGRQSNLKDQTSAAGQKLHTHGI